MFFLFSIRDLLKFKEEVTKERDQLLLEVVKLRESLAQTTGQQQEMERSKEEAEQAISQVCLIKGYSLLEDSLSFHSPLFIWFSWICPLVPKWSIPCSACFSVWFMWEQFYLGHSPTSVSEVPKMETPYLQFCSSWCQIRSEHPEAPLTLLFKSFWTLYVKPDFKWIVNTVQSPGEKHKTFFQHKRKGFSSNLDIKALCLV